MINVPKNTLVHPLCNRSLPVTLRKTHLIHVSYNFVTVTFTVTVSDPITCIFTHPVIDTFRKLLLMLFLQHNFWICANFLYCILYKILYAAFSSATYEGFVRQLSVLKLSWIFWSILKSNFYHALVYSHSVAALSEESGPHAELTYSTCGIRADPDHPVNVIRRRRRRRQRGSLRVSSSPLWRFEPCEVNPISYSIRPM